MKTTEEINAKLLDLYKLKDIAHSHLNLPLETKYQQKQEVLEWVLKLKCDEECKEKLKATITKEMNNLKKNINAVATTDENILSSLFKRNMLRWVLVDE